METSKEIIQKAKDRFKELEHKNLEWRSFYTGFLEAKAQQLTIPCSKQLKDKKVMPFEDWLKANKLQQINPNSYQKGNTTYNHAFIWQEYKKAQKA